MIFKIKMFNQIDATKVHKTFQIASINYILKRLFYTTPHHKATYQINIQSNTQKVKKNKKMEYPHSNCSNVASVAVSLHRDLMRSAHPEGPV
jgi:hypothetical protein